MNEIGGYFGLETFSGKEYHHDLIGVNSGRNALLYILKARGYRKLYIPRFLCDSVSQLCHREGYEYEEYPITEDFLPVFDRSLASDEVLYIVNFYGQVSNEQLLQIKGRFHNVIFDNVQDFFRKPIAGVDTVYSCRKFFGVPDGGYVACDAKPLLLEADYSKDRMTHILGRFEVSGAAFYDEFRKNDELFYELPLRSMSPLTRNLLQGTDYENVCKARNANYERLAASLDAHNPLKLSVPNGPYCYPFYCENGMTVKKKLAQQKIYVATLWPNVLEHEGTLEKEYAENILPLPCDQRYGQADMHRVIDAICSCMAL